MRRLLCLLALTVLASAPAVAQFGAPPSGQPGTFRPRPNGYEFAPGGFQPQAPTTVFPSQPLDEPAATDPRHTAAANESPAGALAADLEVQAKDLCLELHENYRQNPGWQQTYSEAYEILITATYIRGLERAGNPAKARRAALELDDLFHHVEGDVAGWTPHAQRRVGHGGLTAKLEDVEETLHALLDEVRGTPVGAGDGLNEEVPLPDSSSDAPFGSLPSGSSGRRPARWSLESQQGLNSAPGDFGIEPSQPSATPPATTTPRRPARWSQESLQGISGGSGAADVPPPN